MKSSCRVMDTIHYKASWIHRYPDLAARGEGLLVILEPADAPDAPPAEGSGVVARRPDGSAVGLVVTGVECRGGMVGLFFRGAAPDDVPRGSTVEW